MSWTEYLPENMACLSTDGVEVWQAEFGLFCENLDQFEQILSPDEQQRAKRYRQKQDQVRFIVARGVLRRILAGYVGVSPSEVELGYHERGKPFLKTHREIEFNVSHSEDQALFAIALHRRVGIDVEYIRSIEVLSLAKRFFSKSEYLLLRSLEGREQLRGFFQLWTAKEAYLKATGEGLSGLEAVEISLSELESNQKLAVQGMGSVMVLQLLKVGEGYCATVAVED